MRDIINEVMDDLQNTIRILWCVNVPPMCVRAPVSCAMHCSGMLQPSLDAAGMRMPTGLSDSCRRTRLLDEHLSHVMHLDRYPAPG